MGSDSRNAVFTRHVNPKIFMKNKFQLLFAFFILHSAFNLSAHAQGTAFTYQGRLNSGGSPADGSYDLTFSLFATNASGVAIAGPVTNTAVAVSNGLFTTTVNFGNAFAGASNWLEIGVSTNGANAFLTLSPRQQVTPTPYAITAENVVGLTVQQNTNGSPNVIEGSSVNYVSNSVYGATIAGGGTANFSNSVTADFGTVGGGGANTASGWASTVGGGAGNIASSPDGSATVGGGYYNTASGDSATVGGGDANTASGDSATVGGGAGNTDGSPYASIGGGGYNFIGTNSNSGTISGGFANQIADNTHDSAIGGGSYGSIGSNSFASTLAGGSHNSIGSNASVAAIGGGTNNTASGIGATVAGGANNTAAGSFSFAAGQQAQALYVGDFVWADSQNATFASTAINQFLIRAGNGVGIGTTSPQAALHVRGADGAQFILQNSADNSFWYFSDDVNDNLVFQPNTGVGGYIDRAGNYHNNSDVRLKRDITPIDGVLDKVLQLRPVSYRFRTAPEGTPLTFGLIAQEVEPLFPEVVGERAGTKSLAYSELIPVTIRAVQELNQKLEGKNSEIQNLIQQNDLLEKRLSELETTVKSLAEKK